VEVLQHWEAGRSLRHLAAQLGMGRVPARRIIEVAETGRQSPGGPPPSPEEWARRVPELFSERLDGRAQHAEQLLRFHEAIRTGLATNTVRTTWQRLCDEQGFGSARRRSGATCASTCSECGKRTSPCA